MQGRKRVMAKCYRCGRELSTLPHSNGAVRAECYRCTPRKRKEFVCAPEDK
jgi:hypothetical protein